MKRLLVFILCALMLCGCAPESEYAQVAATTLPVYEFTAALCQGTPITVTRLVTEEVSCLHDYSLNVRQVRAAEAADLIVLSGAGLEAFLDDLLLDKTSVDASHGIELLCPTEARLHLPPQSTCDLRHFARERSRFAHSSRTSGRVHRGVRQPLR